LLSHHYLYYCYQENEREIENYFLRERGTVNIRERKCCRE